jgi:3-hydroxyisobutyrate dehydrogenase-like beta-hydroxyacid dehydrogenase
MKTPEQVGLIGVGLLGSTLAERFLDAGFSLLCFDANPGQCAAAAARGARTASTLDETAQCRRIVLSLPDSRVVREVTAELSVALAPGHILIDTTTGDPADTAELAGDLGARGIDYLDATISGSSEQARRGDTVIMAGGRPEVYEACRDILGALSPRCFHLGPCGAGQSMKLVSNLVMGLNRAALAEGLAFAEALGMDGDAVLQVLMTGLPYSRVMDTKGVKMLRRDFTPQARLSQHIKDVNLMIAAAGRVGLTLSLSETHRQLLETARSAGLGDADNCAVIETYRSRRSR